MPNRQLPGGGRISSNLHARIAVSSKVIMKKLGMFAVVLAFSAGNAPSPATTSGSATPPATAPATPASQPCKPAAPFIDRVWRVRESSSVAPGTLYVFLSDG